ncbi:hypothetical protein pb186bvf_020216 [Paramecium bursaria]
MKNTHDEEAQPLKNEHQRTNLNGVREASEFYCTSCGQTKTSQVDYKVGVWTWLCCIFLCFFTIIGGLVPFCLKFCKDAHQVCPGCAKPIAFYIFCFVLFLQWDNRFFLAKLSDYEIKRDRSRKQTKRQTPQKLEIKQPQIKFLDLQQIWERHRIPQFHCAYYLQYVKNPEAIQKEMAELCIGEAPIQRLMKLIRGREKCLRFLQVEQFEDTKYSELIAHLRILTINVVEAFKKWRDQLDVSVRFRIGEQDYIEKLQQDTSILAQHYELYNLNDPFFIWFIKLAHQKHMPEYVQYHLISRELFKRIRECEILIIEHNFYNQQNNILSKKEALIIAQYLNESKSPSSEKIMKSNMESIKSNLGSPQKSGSPQKQGSPQQQSQHEDIGHPNQSQSKSQELGQKMYQLTGQDQIQNPHYSEYKIRENNLQKLLDFQGNQQVEQSFKLDPDLYDKILFQQSKIITINSGQQIIGLLVAYSIIEDNYKKWLIDYVKLENIEQFQQLIEFTLPLIKDSHEILIKLMHFQQNDRLIDCDHLKSSLKALTFKWKQQTNDNHGRYTIYSKRQQFDLQHHFKIDYYVYKPVYPPIVSKIKTSNNSFKLFLHNRVISTEEMDVVEKDQKIQVIDYKLKLIDSQCAVIDGFCYFQIKQDNSAYARINNQDVYMISTSDSQIQLLIAKGEISAFDQGEFQMMNDNLSIPMFEKSDNILDLYTSDNVWQFKEDVLLYPQEQLKGIVIREQFNMYIIKNNDILSVVQVKQADMIRYYQKSYQYPLSFNQPQIKNTFDIFRIEGQPIYVDFGNYAAAIQLEPNMLVRRWNIVGIIGQRHQFQEHLQNITNYLLIIDNSLQEIAINVYHKMVDNQYNTLNKIITQNIGEVGYKWKQQVNTESYRFTKYVFKNPLAKELKGHLNINYSFNLDQQPAYGKELNKFTQSLTESQLFRYTQSALPHTKVYLKDYPIQIPSDVLLHTSIKTCFEECNFQENYFVLKKQSVLQYRCEQFDAYLFQTQSITMCVAEIKQNISKSEIEKIIINNMQNISEEAQQHIGIPYQHFERQQGNIIINLQINRQVPSEMKLEYLKLKEPLFIGILDQRETQNQFLLSL